jgi:phage gpG-like protein
VAGGFATQVDVEGLEDARRIARQVRNLGEEPRPLLEIAGSLLEASTIRRFQTGRGPGGVPWPQTKRQVRDAVGESGPNKAKILVDTGDLRDSIRYELRPDEVEVGSDGLKNPVKALANQFGSNRQAVVLPHTRVITSAFGIPLPQPVTVRVRAHGRVTNLPARPFVGVDDEDRRDLVEAWLDHLRSLFK